MALFVNPLTVLVFILLCVWLHDLVLDLGEGMPIRDAFPRLNRPRRRLGWYTPKP
jgi:hypothetical protein